MNHRCFHIICPVPRSPKSRTRIWIPICLVPEPMLDQAAHRYQRNTVYPHATHCSIIRCRQLELRKVHNKVLTHGVQRTFVEMSRLECWGSEWVSLTLSLERYVGHNGRDLLSLWLLLVGLSFNCKHQTLITERFSWTLNEPLRP